MSKAEAEAVRALFDSILDGTRTACEVSDELEVNLALIEATAKRLAEQRAGRTPPPPDSYIEYFVPLVYRTMGLRY